MVVAVSTFEVGEPEDNACCLRLLRTGLLRTLETNLNAEEKSGHNEVPKMEGGHTSMGVVV